jgi:hypothetical protein
MVPIHFTTNTNPPVATLIGTFTELWGVAATEAKDATYYVKVYWQGNSNVAPVVGTTTPNVTFAILAGNPSCIFAVPVILQGPMWYTVTLNPADADTTVLATGGDVVTLFVG